MVDIDLSAVLAPPQRNMNRCLVELRMGTPRGKREKQGLGSL